jgi:hypothetical protein
LKPSTRTIVATKAAQKIAVQIEGSDELVRSDTIWSLRISDTIMLPINNQPTNRTNRARRRAVVSLGGLAIGFIAISQLATVQSSRESSDPGQVPHFALDFENASQAELRLLPSVGEKTAQSWIDSRSQPTFTPPKTEADLEKLPQVGPRRAQQLAPHLLETNR